MGYSQSVTALQNVKGDQKTLAIKKEFFDTMKKQAYIFIVSQK